MTTLFQQAIREVEKRSDAEQDMIAHIMLREAQETEEAARESADWEEKLAGSHDVLEALLDESDTFRAQRKARKAALQAARQTA